jgi:hypothetical protein
MISARLIGTAVSVVLALAAAHPAVAQGKSGQPHGKPAAPPATSTNLGAAAASGAATGTGATAPFAWMDDANLMAPGALWLGVSMVQWRGGGATEVVVPAFDASVGLTPRVQLGASVPRVAGGVGTAFFTTKIGLFANEARGLKIAAGPTLEILNQAAMLSGPAGQSRTQWGLPVSVEVDRQASRFYGTSGYFSPGVWYAGIGAGRSLSERLGLSLSLSHASTRQATTPGASAPSGPRRNDLSGGVAFDLSPTIAVFGSIGRTLATAAANGAGTTVSFGMSLSAGQILLTK